MKSGQNTRHVIKHNYLFGDDDNTTLTNSVVTTNDQVMTKIVGNFDKETDILMLD